MQPNDRAALRLPEPDRDSARHSADVARLIEKRIADAGGSISFAEFMQLALYAPGFGYYAAGARKFGRDGDYVTAPEVSPLFGRVLARQVAAVLSGQGGGDVLEIGPGSGALAAALLGKLRDLRALPDRYLLLEVSPDLTERQQSLLREQVPDCVERCAWLPGLPASFEGVIIANEVLDALPVERFSLRRGNVFQARVVSRDGEFCWDSAPAPVYLAEAVRNVENAIGRPLADGYTSELATALPGWIADLAASLARGFVFLFDYGISRREYYAAERTDGWLRCHFRHRAHDDPLILAGIQDLTAWVDFSAVAAAAIDSGLAVAGYVSQSQFLTAGGLAAELSDFAALPIEAQARLSQQVKLLTLPAEMGEHFKCMGLKRGPGTVPDALSGGDRAHSL